MQSRRERLREATFQEIKETARQQMYAGGGIEAISLRGIATTMGITAPALYRYFASRDDLITALLVDAYTSLGDNIEQAIHQGMPPGEQFYQAALAYRKWALDNSGDFDLIFGQPLPGYKAPAELTVPLVQRAFAPFLMSLHQAEQSGLLNLPSHYVKPPEYLETNLSKWLVQTGAEMSPAVLYFGLTKWGQMHGLVALELNGQFHSMAGAATSDLYEGEMRELLRVTGLL